ncbi:MAG: sigma factor-like helix-turn-helix DNA-binding protein [Candidatus Hodgkinia cicadicola]
MRSSLPPPKPHPNNLLIRTSNKWEVYYALSLLPPRQRLMLLLRCCRPSLTFNVIANEYKLSKERVRQICVQGIKTLNSLRVPLPQLPISLPLLTLFQVKPKPVSSTIPLASLPGFSPFVLPKQIHLPKNLPVLWCNEPQTTPNSCSFSS